MREKGSPGEPRAGGALTARTAVVTASGQVASRASTLLLTVAGTAVVTRAIGQEGFADWGTLLMLTAMFAFMLDPGFAPIVVRRLAEPGAEAPGPGALLRVRLVFAAVAYVLVVVLAVILRGTPVLVLGLVLAAQLFPRAVVMNTGTWMQAEHRLHRQTTLEAVTVAGGLGLLVIAAALDAPAAVLAGVGVVLPIVVLAVLMDGERRRISHGRHTPARERELVRAVLREAAPLAGAIVLVSIYTRIGVVFVNEADSGAAVAGFTFAFLFIEQAFVVAAIVAATLLPMLAERGAGGDGGRDPLVADMLGLVALIGSVGALALIALARPLVLAIGGDELEGAVDLLILLAPACAALFGNLYLGYLHVAAGLTARYLAFNLVGLGLSVALGLALTLNHGATAAARVTWITETVVVLLAAVTFFWKRADRRDALLNLCVPLGLAIACSEAAAAGTVAPGVSALAGAALMLAVSARRGRTWLSYARAALAR
jgi:O-antigen/teichoic acid export membrane protein